MRDWDEREEFEDLISVQPDHGKKKKVFGSDGGGRWCTGSRDWYNAIRV